MKVRCTLIAKKRKQSSSKNINQEEMLIDFKGKYISVKEFDCKLGKLQEEPIAPFVNLFVKVTKGCNAKCLFCSNAGTSVPHAPFNV